MISTPLEIIVVLQIAFALLFVVVSAIVSLAKLGSMTSKAEKALKKEGFTTVIRAGWHIAGRNKIAGRTDVVLIGLSDSDIMSIRSDNDNLSCDIRFADINRIQVSSFQDIKNWVSDRSILPYTNPPARVKAHTTFCLLLDWRTEQRTIENMILGFPGKNSQANAIRVLDQLSKHMPVRDTST